MSEPAFTPGPWTLRYDPGKWLTGTDAEIAEMEDCEPYGVACARIPEIGWETAWDDRREQKQNHLANGRLLAASPEMYEALRHAEAILSYAPRISTNKGGRGPSATTEGALAKVRAALAKVEGDSA